MPLTPEDIRDKKFSTVRGFREGYSLREVDAFLDEVQQDLSNLLAELAGFRAKNAVEEENKASAVRMLELAQRTAEDHVAAAKAEAERVIHEAREKIAALHAEADVQRAAMERRVDDLKAFEKEYRSRLRSFIEAAVSDLDGRGQD